MTGRAQRIVLGLAVGLALVVACAPRAQREVDDWGRATVLEPEITGDNAKDEERWLRELESDPWGKDDHLLTDEPPETAADYEDENVPPLDFVGPPEPPSSMDSMQKGSRTVGKALFSVLTVLVTLGMMAAPYLLMI